MDVSAGERVREVVGHEAEQLIRAWLRGDHHPDAVDVELLDDPDVTTLAASLRQCVTDGCLDVAAVRSVFDLSTHIARPPHDVVRLGDRTDRALGLLQMHASNARVQRLIDSRLNDFIHQMPQTVAHINEQAVIDWLLRGMLDDLAQPMGLHGITHGPVLTLGQVAAALSETEEEAEGYLRKAFDTADGHDRVFRCRDGRLIHAEYRADPDAAPWGGWCFPSQWMGLC